MVVLCRLGEYYVFFNREEDDDDDEEEDEESKSCSNICQNLLNCSLGYIYKHIGIRKFLTKALWIYSHLKSGCLFLQKVT